MNIKTELEWLDLCLESLYQERETALAKIDQRITDLVKLKADIKAESLIERMA